MWWTVGLLVFIGGFAWLSAPNPSPVNEPGDPFVGRWLINGTDAFGEEYSGSLTIRKSGDEYALDWIVTGAVITGTGTSTGEILTAEWQRVGDGRQARGTGEYRVQDGLLVGELRSEDSAEPGHETGELIPGS